MDTLLILWPSMCALAVNVSANVSVTRCLVCLWYRSIGSDGVSVGGRVNVHWGADDSVAG